MTRDTLFLLAGMHVFLGIGLPAAYAVILITRRAYSPVARHLVGAWVLASWGLFALSIALFLLLNFGLLGGYGSLVAIVIGVVPFAALAGLFFCFSLGNWRSIRKSL